MLLEVYVNGHWDADLIGSDHVTIYDKGIVYQLDDSLYDKFIDSLETEGFDCYFCPQLFKNPNWNGIIKHI